MLALFLAVPATAQTVVIMDFSKSPANEASVSRRTEDGFALNLLGASKASRDTVASVWTQATNDIPTTEGPTPASDACLAAESPPVVSGLGIGTVQRRAKWWPAVARAECQHGLPPGLLDALILAESGYVEFATSSAGARGLTQLMPATASELGVVDRYDPLGSIDGGARYLHNMLEQFGSVTLALAAYNAGPKAVSRSNGIPANTETPGYVRRVLAYWPLTAGSPIQRLRQTAQLLGFTGVSND